METIRRILMALSMVLVAYPASAADAPCYYPCGKPTSWFDFNVFTLKVTLPDSKWHWLWRGQWDKDSMDIQIDAETFDGSVTKTGKILMVSGRVMAVQGDAIEPGYEIDALDAPVLQQQLVLRLLGAALPEGVVGLKGSNKIDHSNQKTGIQFTTPSAQGFIAPPWHVSGTVNLVTSDVVEYDLALTSGVKGKAFLRSPIEEFQRQNLRLAVARRLDSVWGWGADEEVGRRDQVLLLYRPGCRNLQNHCGCSEESSI